jgi:hypothetical protein
VIFGMYISFHYFHLAVSFFSYAFQLYPFFRYSSTVFAVIYKK